MVSSIPFLDTVEGEISFFRALMRARPVGIHRHFHALAIHNSIHNDTSHSIPIDDIWRKLRSCYDLDALEGLETEGYETPGSSQSSYIPAGSPTPSENIFSHPFFRAEYTLPHDHTYEKILALRRMRESMSLPSSSPPPRSSPSPKPRERKERSGKRKVDTAGLIGGDSDSSALTQESGDEGTPLTPRESNHGGSGTDGTDFEDDTEMRDVSPDDVSPTTKSTRSKGSTKSTKKSGAKPRTSTAGSTRNKKRKR